MGNDTRYAGRYAAFDTVSKREGAVLNGADCLVGDVFDIVFKTEDDVDIAWMRNRFGADVAFFDPRTSRELAIMKARGWTLRALLSYVAYTDSPEPQRYWGEAALICNHPNYDEAVDAFARNVGEKMAEGGRPDIDLEKSGIDQLIESGGSWMPKKSCPRRKPAAGTAIIKDKRLASEKLVEVGRERKPGCYVASWAFLIALGAGIVFGILKLTGVL